MEKRDYIEKILVDEKAIGEITARIAKEIDEAYAGRTNRLLLLGILKGSVVFMGDLMKKITLPVEIDFMKVSSYGSGTVSGGKMGLEQISWRDFDTSSFRPSRESASWNIDGA